MPAISMFYGIIVYMYFTDTKEHHQAHLHAKYQEQEAVIAIPGGELLAGSLPPAKMRLVTAWIEIHQDELIADWQLAVNREQLFRIEPLR